MTCGAPSRVALRRPSRRGVVLIVVLGILAVLALLATTFASIQQTERSVSRAYLDKVRSRLIAQSGVEYAIAQLNAWVEIGQFDKLGTAIQYWGNNDSRAGNPDWATPLERAKCPSLA